MHERGFRYHTTTEVEKRGWDAVMDGVVADADDGPECHERSECHER